MSDYAREIRLMAKAIESRDMPQLQALVQKFSERIGSEKVCNLLAEQVLSGECSLEASDWYWRSILPPEMYLEMKDRAMDAMFGTMIEQGLTPGVDFSFAPDKDGDRHIVLSERAKQNILSHIPEHLHDKFEGHFKSPQEERSPVELIEESLGLSFFDNLKTIAQERIQTLSDAEARGYLGAIVGGIELCHPELGEGVAEWLIANAVTGDRWDDIISGSETAEATCWVEDVVKAAGGKPQDGMLSRDDLMLLGKVWQGTERRVEEVVAALDQAERRWKEQ